MTTESWPTTPGAKVVARFANVASDGADPDTLPDWAPKVGVEVRFVPSIKGPMVYDPTGMKIIMEVAAVTGVMDESGYLKQKNTAQTLYLAPTNDPLMTKTGWVWTAAWDTGSVVFATPSMGEVNLADFITAPAVDATKSWIDRIPELIEIAEGPAGPANVLTVGTVETLPHTEPVTVEITGISPTQVLNVGIPGPTPAPDTSSFAEKGSTIGVIRHATAEDPRPAGYGAVYWIGELEPVNSAIGDIWRTQ